MLDFKFMKKQYTVLEVLFLRGRAELLRLLFASPQKEYYVRELMGASGLTLSAIQHGLRKFSALRLVTSRSNRYHRFYRANRDHPLFADLVHIVEISEKTPRFDRSAVHRQRNKRRPRKLAHLPPDYPTNWHLFSKHRKLDRNNRSSSL